MDIDSRIFNSDCGGCLQVNSIAGFTIGLRPQQNIVAAATRALNEQGEWIRQKLLQRTPEEIWHFATNLAYVKERSILKPLMPEPFQLGRVGVLLACGLSGSRALLVFMAVISVFQHIIEEQSACGLNRAKTLTDRLVRLLYPLCETCCAVAEFLTLFVAYEWYGNRRSDPRRLIHTVRVLSTVFVVSATIRRWISLIPYLWKYRSGCAKETPVDMYGPLFRLADGLRQQDIVQVAKEHAMTDYVWDYGCSGHDKEHTVYRQFVQKRRECIEAGGLVATYVASSEDGLLIDLATEIERLAQTGDGPSTLELLALSGKELPVRLHPWALDGIHEWVKGKKSENYLSDLLDMYPAMPQVRAQIKQQYDHLLAQAKQVQTGYLYAIHLPDSRRKDLSVDVSLLSTDQIIARSSTYKLSTRYLRPELGVRIFRYHAMPAAIAAIRQVTVELLAREILQASMVPSGHLSLQLMQEQQALLRYLQEHRREEGKSEGAAMARVRNNAHLILQKFSGPKLHEE